MNSDRKKQLRNEYKSKPAVGAVYAIDCSGNGRRLMKSTVDIGGIKSRYNFAISTKGSPDPSLNNEWLKYGSESFSLTVLEEMTMREGQSPKEFADDMNALYELWLEKTDAEK